MTVTDARVTNDLQHATVFYTVLRRRQERADTAAALESAKGVLRSEVGRRTGIRLTPDAGVHRGRDPGERRAHRGPAACGRGADAEVAALAATAVYAGDPDPYRHDDEDDDEDDDEGGEEDSA